MSNVLKTYEECEVEKTQKVLGAGCAAVGNHLDVLAWLALLLSGQMAPNRTNRPRGPKPRLLKARTSWLLQVGSCKIRSTYK